MAELAHRQLVDLDRGHGSGLQERSVALGHEGDQRAGCLVAHHARGPLARLKVLARMTAQRLDDAGAGSPQLGLTQQQARGVAPAARFPDALLARGELLAVRAVGGAGLHPE